MMASGPSSERPRGVLSLFLALNRRDQGGDAVDDQGTLTAGQWGNRASSFPFSPIVIERDPMHPVKKTRRTRPRLPGLSLYYLAVHPRRDIAYVVSEAARGRDIDGTPSVNTNDYLRDVIVVGFS